MIEAVLRHLDRMCPAATFPYQPRSRSEVRVVIGLYASVRLQHLGQCQKLPPRHLAEAAMGQFLDAIGDAADQEVTAQPRRLAAIQPTPLRAQLRCGEIVQGRKLLR